MPNALDSGERALSFGILAVSVSLFMINSVLLCKQTAKEGCVLLDNKSEECKVKAAVALVVNFMSLVTRKPVVEVYDLV